MWECFRKRQFIIVCCNCRDCQCQTGGKQLTKTEGRMESDVAKMLTMKAVMTSIVCRASLGRFNNSTAKPDFELVNFVDG